MSRLLLAFLLLLSMVGAQAATCWTTRLSGGITYLVLATTPNPFSSCVYVVVSGSEWASYQQAVADNATQFSTEAALQNSLNSHTSILSGLQSTVSAQGQSINTLQGSQSTFQSTLATMQGNYQTLLTYQTDPFDVTQALAAFSFFFSAVLLLYWVSANAGAVLEKIRRPLGRG